jgi:hypothetical protein
MPHALCPSPLRNAVPITAAHDAPLPHAPQVEACVQHLCMDLKYGKHRAWTVAGVGGGSVGGEMLNCSTSCPSPSRCCPSPSWCCPS